MRASVCGGQLVPLSPFQRSLSRETTSPGRQSHVIVLIKPDPSAAVAISRTAVINAREPATSTPQVFAL